jgi:hypothetical protein
LQQARLNVRLFSVLIDKQINKNLVLYSSLILREPIENAYLQDDFPERFLPLLFPGPGGYLLQYKHQGVYLFNASSKSHNHIQAVD